MVVDRDMFGQMYEVVVLGPWPAKPGWELVSYCRKPGGICYYGLRRIRPPCPGREA